VKIAIVVQADKRFIQGVAKLRKSLIKHNREALKGVDFVLISNDISTVSGFKVRKFDVSPYENIDFSNKKTSNIKRFAKTFYKFEAFAVEGYDRVISMDGDQLCLGDISHLLSEELNKYDLCAVPDTCGKWRAFGKTGYYKINSGMLVINKSLLSKNVRNGLINVAASGESWDGGDQGALIGYVVKKQLNIHYLPMTYNTIKRVYAKNRKRWDKIRDDIRLLHFVGHTKPWNGGEKGYRPLEEL
jgi:lipopolysaccharide biosynthesis glycosyltransferase